MEDVITRIQSIYKSLEHPDFHFVAESLRRQPYDITIKQIKQTFEMEEDTDANDDVSFGYLLRSTDQQEWILRLSMVGPYAVVLRLSEGELPEVIFPGKHSLTGQELKLFQLLSAQGIRVLSQAELMHPVALTLYNTDPSNVRLYQALFSDTDVLPWERALGDNE